MGSQNHNRKRSLLYRHPTARWDASFLSWREPQRKFRNLLYVHGNPEGTYQDFKGCMTIADLTEQFVQAKISFDDALQIVQERKIVYAPDATMQAMLSDQQGVP